jgi:hypothetical protein
MADGLGGLREDVYESESSWIDPPAVTSRVE